MYYCTFWLYVQVQSIKLRLDVHAQAARGYNLELLPNLNVCHSREENAR